jgi:hypothetical protein
MFNFFCVPDKDVKYSRVFVPGKMFLVYGQALALFADIRQNSRGFLRKKRSSLFVWSISGAEKSFTTLIIVVNVTKLFFFNSDRDVK